MPFSEQAGFVNFHTSTCHRCKRRIPAVAHVELRAVTIGLFEIVCGDCSQIPEKPGQISIDSASGDNPTAGLETPDGVLSGPVEEVPGRQAEDLPY